MTSTVFRNGVIIDQAELMKSSVIDPQRNRGTFQDYGGDISYGYNCDGYGMAAPEPSTVDQLSSDAYRMFFSDMNICAMLDVINSVLNKKYEKLMGRKIKVTAGFIESSMRKTYYHNPRTIRAMNQEVINTAIGTIDDLIEEQRQYTTWSDWNRRYDGSLGIKQHQVSGVKPRAMYPQVTTY
jgi:hypothetical protein